MRHQSNRDVAILTHFGAGAATPWSVWRLAKGSSGAQRRDRCNTEDANQLRKASTHTSRSAQRPPRDYAGRVTPADRAQTADDFQTAQRYRRSGRRSTFTMSMAPFIYRKVRESPFLRQLVIPFGSARYVALYEIEGGSVVNVLAIAHQFEDDYH